MSMFQESFRKNPNITQLAPKIFIYKNFITGELLQKINDILEKERNTDLVNHNIDWYSNRITRIVPEMHEVWEMASELIYPELVMHPQLPLLRSKEGEPGMFAHADAPGNPHEDCGPICGTCDIAHNALISTDMWDTCCRLHYGLIIYFGDFEGGEIYYPNIDKNGKVYDGMYPFDNNEELSIKPENGDLIIHGAHGDCFHGTKEITKGIRFAFSNFVLPAHTNPGTFYNYKSKEYYEQIKWIKENPEERWITWMQTVNGYTFQEPEALLKDKENGVVGVRYREVES